MAAKDGLDEGDRVELINVNLVQCLVTYRSIHSNTILSA
jgi:hypothetical protein